MQKLTLVLAIAQQKCWLAEKLSASRLHSFCSCDKSNQKLSNWIAI